MTFRSYFQISIVLLFLAALFAAMAADPKPSGKPSFEQANQAALKAKKPAGPLIYGLKPGKGRELVIANCIGCHSPMLIAAQRLDRKRWEETMITMNKKHGLWTLPPSIKDQILDYLATYQAPLPKGEQKDTPWAQPKYRPNPLWR